MWDGFTPEASMLLNVLGLGFMFLSSFSIASDTANTPSLLKTVPRLNSEAQFFQIHLVTLDHSLSHSFSTHPSHATVP